MSDHRDEIRLTIGIDPATLQAILDYLHSTTSIAGTNAATLERIEQALQQIQTKENKIMADQQLEMDALKKIDDATTKIGTNVATMGTQTQTISDDLDKIVAAQKAAGVDPAILSQTQALADRLQTVSDNLDANGAALKAVASKADGATPTNPVPVPPPPPPPTPVVTP